MGVKYLSASLDVSRGAVLKPEKVKEMIDNDFDLTLYTCTSDG